MKSKLLQLLLLLLLPPKAWAFTTPPVTRRASSFEVSSSVSKSSSSSSSSELWKVEKVDHISDWTTKSHTTTYPNPLSLKDKIPSSWFVGLNDAVAAKVQIDALETVDETCVLSDDFLDDDTNTEEECITDRGMNAEAFVLAGPRSEISFDPSTSKACIVTCGGLCPGKSLKELIVSSLRSKTHNPLRSRIKLGST